MNTQNVQARTWGDDSIHGYDQAARPGLSTRPPDQAGGKTLEVRTRAHGFRSRAAVTEALETAAPRRVVVLGCGDGETLPLAPLLETAEVIDFVDYDAEELTRLSETLDPATPDDLAVGVHEVDLTGCIDEVRRWADDILTGEGDADSCLDEMILRLADTRPRFWAPETGERYDLVVCANVLTQLAVPVMAAVDAAWQGRFPGLTSNPGTRDRWNRAMWTFTRNLENAFIGHLDDLAEPGGSIYLSATVHVHGVDRGADGRPQIGGAWIMTATPRLRDYLRPWHRVDSESQWEWWLEQPTSPVWGRLYRVQAVTYRTPSTGVAEAVPENEGRLTGVRIRAGGAEDPDAGVATIPDGTSWVSPTVRVLGHSFHAFSLFPYLGLAVAAAVTLPLSAWAGLSPWVMALILAAAPPTVLGLSWLNRLRTGRDRLTFYRYAAAYLVVAVVLLRVIGVPVLAYLDLTLLAIVSWQAVSRLGCLRVGCCYGKPFRIGVQYGAEHVRQGFWAPLAGVRVFPVQLLEATVCAGIAVLGVAAFLQAPGTGATLALVTLLYAAARFGFEMLRGDPNRPHWLGVSEAQWTSTALAAAVLVLGALGVLPQAVWHLVLGGIVIGGALVQSLYRSRRKTVLHARQVHRIAEILSVRPPAENGRQRDNGGPPNVHSTGFGLRVSSQWVRGESGAQRLVTVSSETPLSRGSIRRLSSVVRELTWSSAVERAPGRDDVIHFLLTAPDPVVVTAARRSTDGV